jgi:RNA polymerase sigma-70 factor (ECF subfamily)
VFTKIWNSFESYDSSKGRLFTWMLVITRNSAKDMLRSKQYKQEQDTEDIEYFSTQIDQVFHVVFNNDVLCIKNLVTGLKKDHRDIIELMYFKGYTQTETAEKLGIPVGTVKTRCRMALQLLRVIFKSPDAATTRKYA